MKKHGLHRRFGSVMSCRVSSTETYAYDAYVFLTKRTVVVVFLGFFFFFWPFFRMTGRMALGCMIPYGCVVLART